MNHRLARDVQMPFMRWIKGAAQNADAAAAGEGRDQEDGKAFFFEKNKAPRRGQKTFANRGSWQTGANASRTTFFCFFLFTKRSASFCFKP
jgi:hypothetical protein